MTTVTQTSPLIKHLFEILEAHRPLFKQQRVYLRVVALVLAELFVFSRHTVTQLLMTLGLVEEDWSSWYRLFSRGRIDWGEMSGVVLKALLEHVEVGKVLVVAGDATQTARSGGKVEGVSWLRNLRTPRFRIGIHKAQRWFNLSVLLPPEGGYSRALPLRWLPAFTEKARRRVYAARKEWEAALEGLRWLRGQMEALGRAGQRVLFVGDGNYDHLELWRNLPEGVILLARSAKNRVLYHLPEKQPGRGRPRKYGKRAPTPQQVWGQRRGWQRLTLLVRGRERHVQVKVRGPFVRYGAPERPVWLIVVRGKDYRQGHRRTRRDPLPFLVSAVQNASGEWVLPLALETLLFWAWQRWDIETAHREMKAGFGLGDKQCWNPHAAVASVQWSAWVYALLVLAGYRTWGLTAAPDVPTRWWRGSTRWSFNTLLRAFRAELWGQHDFSPLCSPSTGDWGKKESFLLALRNAVFASARA